MSHQVSRMEKRGLVVREECVSDARGSMVRLTDAVRAYFLDKLSRDEQEVLTKLLDRVLADLPARDLCREGPTSPAGGC